VRAGGHQAVSSAVLARVALFLGEPDEVARVFDLPPALPGAVVRGDVVVSVEDAHELVGGHEPQGLSYERVRNRIVVAVEAQVRRLSGAQGLERVAVEGMGGQRQEAGPLVVQRHGDGALVRVSGDEARVRSSDGVNGRGAKEVAGLCFGETVEPEAELLVPELFEGVAMLLPQRLVRFRTQRKDLTPPARAHRGGGDDTSPSTST